MVHAVIIIIAVLAIIGIVMWYVGKVGIQPPLIYVIYAGVAIACILLIVWLVDSFGGGFALR